MTILAKRIDDMIKSHNTDNAVVSALLYGNPNYELTTNDYPNIVSALTSINNTLMGYLQRIKELDNEIQENKDRLDMTSREASILRDKMRKDLKEDLQVYLRLQGILDKKAKMLHDKIKEVIYK